MYRTVETSAVDLAAHRNVLSAHHFEIRLSVMQSPVYIFYRSLKSTNPYKSLVLYTFAT